MRSCGLEALLRLNVQGFSIYGGLNDYEPRRFDPRLINPEFQTKYGIVGALIGIMPNMYAYAEARVFDDSAGARTPLIILLAVLYTGCAGRTQPPAPPSAAVSPIDEAEALEEFQEEIDEYVELRHKLESQLPSLPTQAAPEQAHAHAIALGDLIISARQRAKQGDIFFSQIDRLIREREQSVFARPEGAQYKATIQDEQSERNVAARVNQRYPDDLPLSAVPASVLVSLPLLPPELQYRFLRRHLILIDIGARIIVDYLPDVLPR